MPKCFLSYSSGYEHLKEPFRRLLEVLGFDAPVDVFDGPDLDAVPDVVLQKIQNADAVVVLYGPRDKPARKEGIEAAKWPYEETILARGMGKPIAMIIHGGTPLPQALIGYSTPARFDFWDSDSFLNNVNHIVNHLLEFERRIVGLGQSSMFRFKRAIGRSRILSDESMRWEVYHEVVARHSCMVFQHSIDIGGGDTTAVLPSPDQLNFKLRKQVGPESVQLSVRFGRISPHDIEYFVEVSPALEPGQELGYWRSFELPNMFPLTRAQLAERAAKPGFPKSYPPNTYGDAWDVTYDIDTTTQSLHFPWDVRLANYGVRVLHYHTREENPAETQRCKAFVQFHEDPSGSERILELTVPNPLVNHSYFLLYEPKD